MKKVILTLLLSLVFSSCKNAKRTDDDSNVEGLFGSKKKDDIMATKFPKGAQTRAHRNHYPI